MFETPERAQTELDAWVTDCNTNPPAPGASRWARRPSASIRVHPHSSSPSPDTQPTAHSDPAGDRCKFQRAPRGGGPPGSYGMRSVSMRWGGMSETSAAVPDGEADPGPVSGEKAPLAVS
jgi:hypothetical protein